MSRGRRNLFLAFGVLFCCSGLASSVLQWSPTGSMASARLEHTATLLPSGLILVAGGTGSGGVSATTELYDPATGTWAPTGSLASARKLHTATLLPSGQVLVVGGDNGTGPLASTELYDPATGTWAPTGPLASARLEHTATLLPSGKILVVGGPQWRARPRQRGAV